MPRKYMPEPTVAKSPRRRRQFNFSTLAEVVAGCALACALIVEMGRIGIGLIVAVILVLLISRYLGASLDGHGAVRLLLIAVPSGIMLFCSFGMLLPAIGSGQGSSDNRCRNNLRRLAIALRMYHDDHGSYPPTVVMDTVGQPLHSWRTLILPYLDESEAHAAHARYDFSQSWDAPENQAVANIYRRSQQMRLGRHDCPDDPGGIPGRANFFMIVGPGRLAEGQTALRLSDIGDVERDTILLVESDSLNVDWFELRDLTVDEVLRGLNPPGTGMSSQHRTSSAGRGYAVVNVAFADGSVRPLPESVDRETWRALLTIDGGERVDPASLQLPTRAGMILWLCLLTIVYATFVTVRHWGWHSSLLAPQAIGQGE
jgi:prepilin-type processing-associated H-X9-DG protein